MTLTDLALTLVVLIVPPTFWLWIIRRTAHRRYLEHSLFEGLLLDLDQLRHLHDRIPTRDTSPYTYTRLRRIREAEDTIVALLDPAADPSPDAQAIITQRNRAVARVGIRPAAIPTAGLENHG